MTTIYDAGALIAADRGDRVIWSDHRAWLALGMAPVATAPVVAQVSGRGSQARLRMFLGGCTIVPFGADEAHAVGGLLRRSGTSEVIDAHVVHVAAGGEIVTSDPRDFEVLVDHVTPRPVVRTV